jgi:hypothetical protein
MFDNDARLAGPDSPQVPIKQTSCTHKLTSEFKHTIKRETQTSQYTTLALVFILQVAMSSVPFPNSTPPFRIETCCNDQATATATAAAAKS